MFALHVRPLGQKSKTRPIDLLACLLMAYALLFVLPVLESANVPWFS